MKKKIISIKQTGLSLLSTQKTYLAQHINQMMQLRINKFYDTSLISQLKRYIPVGRIPKIHIAIPTDVAALVDESDDLRKTDPGNPPCH